MTYVQNKKIAIITIFIGITLILCACGDTRAIAEENNTAQSAKTNNLEGNPFSEPRDTSPAIISPAVPTQQSELSLSNSCDRILAKGTDSDGNTYELVGNQIENYQGFSILVGIIKNNSWIVEPTSSFPFLDENGLFRTPGINGGDKEYDLFSVDNKYFYYVEDAGFFIVSPNPQHSAFYWGTGIFYNCETKESFNADMGLSTSLKFMTSLHDEGETCYRTMLTEHGNIIISHTTDGINGHSHDLYIFNVESFSLKKIVSENRYGAFGPLHEGLFAIGTGYDSSVKAFYNVDGVQVIDLTGYNWDHADTYYFENGQYSFYVKNDLGHRFMLTINQTGEVIEELPQ